MTEMVRIVDSKVYNRNEHKGLSGCIRLLIRLMPFIFEDSKLEEDIFWTRHESVGRP